MANITTRTEVLINASIELKYVPEKVYYDILNYINRTLDGKAGTDTEEHKAVCIAEGVNNSAPENADHSDVKERTWRTREEVRSAAKRVENATTALKKILKEAFDTPKKFDTKSVTAAEIGDYISEFKDIDPRVIGRILGKISKEYQYWIGTGSRLVKNSKDQYFHVKTYEIPVRKPTIGSTIRACRKDVGLTIGELANYIKWPADVVKRWESDEYAVGPDGIAALKGAFGADCFDTLRI